ncbi:unnamed protein product [Discosporangium mesarthrocarpum]
MNKLTCTKSVPLMVRRTLKITPEGEDPYVPPTEKRLPCQKSCPPSMDCKLLHMVPPTLTRGGTSVTWGP